MAGLILIGSLLLQLCQSPEGYNSGYPGPRAPLRLAPILLGYLSSRTVGSPLLRQQKGVWALGCFVLWYFIPGPKTPVASRCGSGGSQTSPSQSFASSDPRQFLSVCMCPVPSWSTTNTSCQGLPALPAWKAICFPPPPASMDTREACALVTS